MVGRKIKTVSINFYIRSLFFISALIVLNSHSLIAKPLKLSNTIEEYDLGTNLRVFEDEDSSKTFKDILYGNVIFSQGQEKELNFGFGFSTYWLRLDIELEETLKGNWVIEFRYPLVDSLEIYIEQADGRFERRTGGDSIEFSKREVDHVHPVFYMEDAFFHGQRIFFKVTSRDSMQIPLTIWKESKFNKNYNKKI